MSILIIIITTIIIAKSQKLTECTNRQQCLYDDISSAQIICSAEDACGYYGGSLTSTNAKIGYIQCSGAQSCSATDSISTASTLYCSSYDSCSDADVIQAKSIECSGSGGCSSQWPYFGPITIENSISCTGWVSCDDTALRPGKKAFCDGGLACSDAQIVGGLYIHSLFCNRICKKKIKK